MSFIFFIVIVCVFLEWKRICVCRYYCWKFSYQERRVGIPLTPPHFCACPKSGSEFSMSYVMVSFVFSEFCQDERFLLVLLMLVEFMTITV